jgi:hypothetical protein
MKFSPCSAPAEWARFTKDETPGSITVALKVLPAHIAHDPALRQRLEREARHLQPRRSPHLRAV